MFKIIKKRFGTTKISLKLDSSCAENLIAATFNDIYQLLTTVGYKYDAESSTTNNNLFNSSSGSNKNVKHIFNICNNHSLEVSISIIKQDGYLSMLRKFKNSLSTNASTPSVEVQLSELLFTRSNSNLAARIKFNRDGLISTFCESHPLVPIIHRERNTANSKLFEIIIPSNFIEGSSISEKGSGLIPILNHIGAVPVPEKYPGVYLIQPSLSSYQPSETSSANSTTDSIIVDNPSLDSVYVRVFPARTMTLILKVPNLREMMEKLRSLSLSTPLLLESIGARASYGANNREQIQLNSPLLYPALDLRITEHAVLSPYFNEGPRAVLEGTIASIQSDRIFGGGGNILEGKLGGSCWTEFHAMVSERCKQGTRAILSAVSSSTTSSSSHTSSNTTVGKKPRISKEPSIVE